MFGQDDYEVKKPAEDEKGKKLNLKAFAVKLFLEMTSILMLIFSPSHMKLPILLNITSFP